MIRQRLEADRPVPEGYLAKPRLMHGLEFLWHAFWELTTERPLGWGVEGRIPGSKITEFGKEHGFTSDTLDWFRKVIREMDAEYLGIRAPKSDELAFEVKLEDTKAIKALLRRHAKPASPPPAPAESQGQDGDH